MFLIIISSLIAITSAAQLPPRIYLPEIPGNVPPSSITGPIPVPIPIPIGGGGRPQQEAEKNAVILKQDQEINENGFHYSYETSNGIRAEEAGNTVQTQGGFSYKGDDGVTYTITFTAGEGGFRPQGDHLPVAPPTPEAILLALQQNERDEAAGIFDDGQYRPNINGGGQTPGQTGSRPPNNNLRPGGSKPSFDPNTGYRY